MLRIGIVAGEASGDYLGAHLIKALREIHGEVSVEGIGGDKMLAEGCSNLFPMDKLSVMGIVEVLGNFRELLDIRRKLLRHFVTKPPDVFIGIDAPDFNLGLEQGLRKENIPTVHYVSPSVWAWRKHRIRKISRSVDLMLTLFPFELDIYNEYGIPARFVGHPLAERIDIEVDKSSARRRLGIDEKKIVVGIMPGSRRSEWSRLWRPFLQTAELCYRKYDNIEFISSVLRPDAHACFKQTIGNMSLEHLPFTVFDDKSHDVLEAADVLLLASGTVTLEAALFKRPMVVAYKLNPLTYMLVKMLSYVDYASLPNLLSGEELVPECLQKDCYPSKLFSKLEMWLEHPAQVTELQKKFAGIHRNLKINGGTLAAIAVLELVDARRKAV